MSRPRTSTMRASLTNISYLGQPAIPLVQGSQYMLGWLKHKSEEKRGAIDSLYKAEIHKSTPYKFWMHCTREKQNPAAFKFLMKEWLERNKREKVNTSYDTASAGKKPHIAAQCLLNYETLHLSLRIQMNRNPFPSCIYQKLRKRIRQYLFAIFKRRSFWSQIEIYFLVAYFFEPAPVFRICFECVSYLKRLYKNIFMRRFPPNWVS